MALIKRAVRKDQPFAISSTQKESVPNANDQTGVRSASSRPVFKVLYIEDGTYSALLVSKIIKTKLSQIDLLIASNRETGLEKAVKEKPKII